MFQISKQYELIHIILQVTQQPKAHSYIRLYAMVCHILASQIASVVESGKLRQLLWHDPLKHDTDDLISEKFHLHQSHVMVLEFFIWHGFH